MTNQPLDTDLAVNLRRYRILAELAETAGPTNLDSMLCYIGAAADSAWHHHPGFFADRELEGLLRLPEQSCGYVPRVKATQIERVLHVFTQTYATGGHTRLAERWMQLDDAREHSVAITWQAGTATPPSLAKAVESRGGRVHHLDRRPGGLSSRAARLERLSAGFDYVVLHTHPSDPIPLAAFRTMRSYSVLLMNHADHVFWLGTTVADLFVSFREAGKSLCMSRRGIAASRNAILPLPVPPVWPDAISGAEAKQRLGVPADAVLVFTVASSYKFSPSVEPGFVEVHVDLLARSPNLYHFVVGISSGAAAWEDASSTTNGRLRAIEPTGDLADYWAAADVYADSFPFSSLTSLLEAMSHGVPCVSFDPFDGTSPVLRLGDAGQLAVYFEGTGIGDYIGAIQHLASDSAKRASAGDQALRTIRDRHWGEGWKKQLESVYAISRDIAAMPREQTTEIRGIGEPSQLDLNLVAFETTYAPLGDATNPIARSFLWALPRRQAIRAIGVPRDWHSLLRILRPDWAMFAVGPLARALRSLALTRRTRS